MADEPVEQHIDLGYTPVLWQGKVHQGLSTHRFAVAVAHRRAGKTQLAIQSLLASAIACTKPQPRFGYVAPRLSQAKRIAWGSWGR